MALPTEAKREATGPQEVDVQAARIKAFSEAGDEITKFIPKIFDKIKDPKEAEAVMEVLIDLAHQVTMKQ